MPTPNPVHRSPYQQLLLPLELPEQPRPSLLPPDTIEATPQQVWLTLAAPTCDTPWSRSFEALLRYADHC